MSKTKKPGDQGHEPEAGAVPDPFMLPSSRGRPETAVRGRGEPGHPLGSEHRTRPTDLAPLPNARRQSWTVCQAPQQGGEPE